MRRWLNCYGKGDIGTLVEEERDVTLKEMKKNENGVVKLKAISKNSRRWAL